MPSTLYRKSRGGYLQSLYFRMTPPANITENEDIIPFAQQVQSGIHMFITGNVFAAKCGHDQFSNLHLTRSSNQRIVETLLDFIDRQTFPTSKGSTSGFNRTMARFSAAATVTHARYGTNANPAHISNCQ